jgi:alkanesulfonate monooxygenase
VKPVQKPYIPINFGGSSEAAIEAAGKHADVYALFGETLAQVREQVARVRAAAARHGRTIRFSLSLRPILAETEDAAWARADALLERVRSARAGGNPYIRGGQPSVGSLRLLDAAARGDRHDKRLWTAIARETGAAGNSTSLVGTVDQVADALLDYYDLGISTFLIRGFDPLEDAVAYGALIERTTALVAERERARIAAE